MEAIEKLYIRDLDRFIEFQLVERLTFELKMYYEIKNDINITLDDFIEKITISMNVKKFNKKEITDKVINFIFIKYNLAIINQKTLRLDKI